MKKIAYVVLMAGIMFYTNLPLFAADLCKVKCKPDKGGVCFKREPCEPINETLLNTARECVENPSVRFLPITKLLFVDILANVIHLDRELPQNISEFEDAKRYELETSFLKNKGIGIFSGTKPLSPLKRDELASVLKDVIVEEDLGYSNGFSNQLLTLNNGEFLIYNPSVYVDEGNGFELWNRKDNLIESSSGQKEYSIKLDTCTNAILAFGDGVKGKIPTAGARIKIAYQFFGRQAETVTECEIVELLSNATLARSLKDAYNPSRPLTKANFADLLIKAMHLEKSLPGGASSLNEKELYAIQARALSKKGINIFLDSDPSKMLTREELAKVLYDSPVEEIIGVSNGDVNQRFELTNAGFMLYDLHASVNEGAGYKEWNKKDSFIESSSVTKDYVVKLDAGDYASIYFGDNKKGSIPALNAPIKVKYRLYAPSNMFTEDDIMCVLGKMMPVAEAYTPPSPPEDFPDPKDGFDDPATHI